MIPVKAAEPRIGPYLTLTQPKDHILNVRVRVLRGNETETVKDPINGTSVDITKTMAFDPMKTLAVIWPLLPDTSSAAIDRQGVTGTLTLDNAVASAEFKVLKNYQGGVEYLRFDAQPPAGGDLTPKEVELEVHFQATCSKTEFDEAAALKVGWPAAWPRDAQQWLQPQLFVEQGFDDQNRLVPYKDELVVAAVKDCLAAAGVNDVKKTSPVMAAKIITARVWGGVQVMKPMIGLDGLSGELSGFRLSPNTAAVGGDIGGIVVMPPNSLLETKRGTQYDVVALLTAMLRKAGIPARPVIGYDRASGGGASASDKLYGSARGGNTTLRTWVEFALFDEAANTINWIPIDIVRMSKSRTRASPVNRPWRFFGTNDEFNLVIPFAFHFHPPTDVLSYGAPGFWGWFVTPQAPKSAGQSISFTATSASKRAEDMPGRKGEEKNDKKKDDEKKDKKKKAVGY